MWTTTKFRLLVLKKGSPVLNLIIDKNLLFKEIREHFFIVKSKNDSVRFHSSCKWTR